MNSGLRQGCALAPTLFNLYACVVAEKWLDKVSEIEGVGAQILYKLDHQLFRRYTRGASQKRITEGQFADDVALLTVTREVAERAISLYHSVAKAFGLTVSIAKTKFMVSGSKITQEDKLPINIQGGTIEHVDEFQYLGSIVTENGTIDTEIDRRIANASKAFGALRAAVFKDHNLKIATKRLIYHACVLSVLLYGAECWTPLRRHLKRLNSFHHRCIRSALGITNQQQWRERISSEMVRKRWGDEETITTKLLKRRLEWLGHVARMPNYRIPKITLFSWLPQPRPRCGPKRRWRDVVKKDLQVANIKLTTWYDEAQHRREWLEAYNKGAENFQIQQQRNRQLTLKEIECTECRRFFRRESDKARHKCVAEREKCVSEQMGAVQCQKCKRWLRSRGGLTVHRCTVENQDTPAPSQPSTQSTTCALCRREFGRPSDKKRHKCRAEREKPIEDQQGAVRCSRCQRWFKSRGGLAVHKCTPTT